MKYYTALVVTSTVRAYAGNEKSGQLTFCFIGGARPGSTTVMLRSAWPIYHESTYPQLAHTCACMHVFSPTLYSFCQWRSSRWLRPTSLPRSSSRPRPYNPLPSAAEIPWSHLRNFSYHEKRESDRPASGNTECISMTSNVDVSTGESNRSESVGIGRVASARKTIGDVWHATRSPLRDGSVVEAYLNLPVNPPLSGAHRCGRMNNALGR